MLFAPIAHDTRGGTLRPGKYGALLGWGLRFGDLACFAIAGVLAWWLRFGNTAITVEYQRHLAMAVLFALPVLSVSRLYRSWRGVGLVAELATMATAFASIFALTILYAIAFKLPMNLSRLWWGMWIAGTLGGGTAARILARSAAAWVRARGMDLRSAVVIGSSNDVERITRALRRQRGTGIRMHGWFEVGQDGSVAHTARLGDIDNLARYVENHHINQVWIALPMSAQQDIARITDALEHSTTDIKFVPDLLGLSLLNQSVEQIAGLPVINLRATPFDGNARLLKGLFDRAFAACAVLCLSPLLAALAIGVKLSSPGPVLFKQKRHGRDGKVIEVWKFRSMRVHQEAHGQVTQATKHDTRVTKFGRFLRRTSLDELPQFINVLQGRMSIVGPRPHAVAHNHEFKDRVQLYMQRHRIKPGITGWAQVNGLRGETDTLDKMTRRVECDLYYLQHWSLWFDLKIVAMTVLKGFLGKNAY